MASSLTSIILTISLFALLAFVSESRHLHAKTIIPAQSTAATSVPSLHSINNTNDFPDSSSFTTCWTTLLELQSCTAEIVTFFINGKTNLGPQCCTAINIIQNNCWPSMFTSLGYDAEESDLLRGYCRSYDPVQTSTAAEMVQKHGKSSVNP